MKPFALVLYEQFLAGKTAEELAQENRIPVDRVRLRLRAAAGAKDSKMGCAHSHRPASR